MHEVQVHPSARCARVEGASGTEADREGASQSRAPFHTTGLSAKNTRAPGRLSRALCQRYTDGRSILQAVNEVGCADPSTTRPGSMSRECRRIAFAKWISNNGVLCACKKISEIPSTNATDQRKLCRAVDHGALVEVSGDQGSCLVPFEVVCA